LANTASFVVKGVIAALACAALALAGFQNVLFSSWRTASGESHVQYRWKQSAGNCEIEYRNVDPDDRRFFSGNISYSHSNKDSQQSIVIQHFSYPQQVGHDLVITCDTVSDVLINVKP